MEISADLRPRAADMLHLGIGLRFVPVVLAHQLLPPAGRVEDLGPRAGEHLRHAVDLHPARSFAGVVVAVIGLEEFQPRDWWENVKFYQDFRAREKPP